MSRYHYWQREIRRREEESPSPTTKSGTPQLAAVEVVDDVRSTSTVAAVEVVAKNGIVVRIGEQVTTEHLRRVLQTVSELE